MFHRRCITTWKTRKITIFSVYNYNSFFFFTLPPALFVFPTTLRWVRTDYNQWREKFVALMQTLLPSRFWALYDFPTDYRSRRHYHLDFFLVFLLMLFFFFVFSAYCISDCYKSPTLPFFFLATLFEFAFATCIGLFCFFIFCFPVVVVAAVLLLTPLENSSRRVTPSLWIAVAVPAHRCLRVSTRPLSCAFPLSTATHDKVLQNYR